ncbi:unnamed protein product [Heterobilharzia americana]|nr:unnamed protein product [Heterobilharzia americana]
MNSHSSDFISDRYSESELLKTIKPIIKNDDADQLLNILTNRRRNFIITTDNDKGSKLERQLLYEHTLLGYDDQGNLLQVSLIPPFSIDFICLIHS